MDKGSDDEAGNPPENAQSEAHEPVVLFIDSKQEQSPPLENAGLTGSPSKDDSDAEADQKFSQVL